MDFVPLFQFSFPQGLLLNRLDNHLGQFCSVVSVHFLSIDSTQVGSLFPRKAAAVVTFAEQFQVLLSNRDFQDTHLLILWTILAACGLHWVRHGTTTLV